MIGAIIGDIAGSRFEWHNIKSKEFELLSSRCFATDDSIMTIAIGKAILECKGNYEKLDEYCIKYMKQIGRHYPDCGFGGHFYRWIYSDDINPYYSFGNGAAMRVSCVARVANSLEDCIELSRKVTEVTHNHPEGIKGAEATAVAGYLARIGKSKQEIKEYISEHYYPMNFTIDQIRSTYRFDETCQGTVPQAIMCFLEAESFEDCIRNAISIGGDSDTVAAIAGGIAEYFYKVPSDLASTALYFLDNRLTIIVENFLKKYPLEK